MTFNYLGVNNQRQNVIPMIREYCLINNGLGRKFYIKLYNSVFVLNNHFQNLSNHQNILGEYSVFLLIQIHKSYLRALNCNLLGYLL